MKLGILALASAAGLLMASAAMAVDVKIGVLNDRSGVYADLSGEGSVVAAQMAVEDFDAAGKGINVEIVSADHQNKPDVASNIARQWYDTEGVDVIVDVPTSSAALAVSEITREKNKIFINSGAGSTDLTGSACTPNTIHWTYDTYALAHGTGSAMVERRAATPGSSSPPTTPSGIRSRRTPPRWSRRPAARSSAPCAHPFPGQDFSSFLLQAQSSGAKVIGLANAGGDTVNAIKQAAEFGITQGGQTLAGLLIFITDVHALGLPTAQGLVLTEASTGISNDDTRAWSERFAERHGGTMPTMVQAGVYSGLLHYLKAVEATGAKETEALMAWMKANPTSDPLFGEGKVRADGRKIHDMYLFTVKAPEASKGPWDYYELVAHHPGRRGVPPARRGRLPARGVAAPHGGRTRPPSIQPQGDAHVRPPRHPAPGPVRPAPARADQRLVLRDAEPRAGGDLRAPQHHQLRPRRPVHDGRFRRPGCSRATSASATGGRSSWCRRSSAPSASSSSAPCWRGSTTSTTSTASC